LAISQWAKTPYFPYQNKTKIKIWSLYKSVGRLAAGEKEKHISYNVQVTSVALSNTPHLKI
jgi:hypothetical protein